MSKQVLSIEQMQHLKELGVDMSKTMMCYRRITRDFRGEEKIGRWSLVINQPIIVSNFETYEDIPAFTLQDILDLLPVELRIMHDYGLRIYKLYLEWQIDYINGETKELLCYRHNGEFIDAAYETLCWVVENGYLETNK